MKLINLNQFKQAKEVELDEVKYQIRTITVDEFLNNEVQNKLDECKTDKERMSTMAEVIVEYTDIPKETLMKQPFGIWNAIIIIIQGGDPTQEGAGKK